MGGSKGCGQRQGHICLNAPHQLFMVYFTMMMCQDDNAFVRGSGYVQLILKQREKNTRVGELEVNQQAVRLKHMQLSGLFAGLSSHQSCMYLTKNKDIQSALPKI